MCVGVQVGPCQLPDSYRLSEELGIWDLGWGYLFGNSDTVVEDMIPQGEREG